MTRRSIRRVSVTALAATTLLLASPFAAGTATAATPVVSAFGVNIQAGGQDVVPATPSAAVATPPGDQSNTLIDVPASPVVVNGTLTATANDHAKADIASGLTVVKQSVPGPYNARALGQIERAGVLYNVAGQGVPILSAALIRSEAAVVCGATPAYTANSEIVDLAVAGTSIPLNAPVQQLVDAISGALKQTGLNAVVDVQRNVVTNLTGGGIGVDALVVTILQAAGATPLAKVRLAHAEVTPGACHFPQCSDGIDNDGDHLIDAADPGCHTDGNAANASTYVPSDDDETNAATAVESAAAAPRAELPKTGGDPTFALAGAGLVGLSGLALTLKRRFAV